MVLIFNFLSLLLLVATSIESSYAIYNPDAYGEKNFTEYYGSRNLIYRVDDYSGKVIFEEKELFHFYSENLIQKDLTDFEYFFFGELAQSLSCPISQMSKSYDYFQFANRTLALSYLYENIESRRRKARELNIKDVCHIDWHKQLNSCKPKSNDMKFFVRSAKHLVKNSKPSYSSSSLSLKKQKRKWLQTLAKNNGSDEASFRLRDECRAGKCRGLDMNGSMNLMRKSCREDLRLFKDICSESDQIYGLAYINESYPLLVGSDILDVIDEFDDAAGCLRKFKQKTSPKELVYRNLELIFPATYTKILESKKRYIQGRLFPAGSMKKFIDLGLENLFKNKKKVIAQTEKKKTKKLSTKVMREDKVEFIDRFVKKKRKKVRLKIAKKKEVHKKRVRKSSFLIASELRDQLDIDQVKVDMNSFKYDFHFSMNLTKVLDESLEPYTTRKGLTELKRNDQLGSKEGAMPLIFLKYLIETQKHQALFNLTLVVGNRFYVQNDIDKAKHAPYDFIELTNNESTGHQWQIFITKP